MKSEENNDTTYKDQTNVDLKIKNQNEPKECVLEDNLLRKSSPLKITNNCDDIYTNKSKSDMASDDRKNNDKIFNEHNEASTSSIVSLNSSTTNTIDDSDQAAKCKDVQTVEDMKKIITQYSSENQRLISLVEFYEKENKQRNEKLEKTSANYYQEVNNSRLLEDSLKKLKDKYNKIIDDYQKSQKQVENYIKSTAVLKTDKENLKKFIFKAYQIFELDPDLNLNDALHKLNADENERRKLIQSHKTLKEDNQNLRAYKTTAETEIKKLSEQTNKLKSQLDDKQLMYLSKEQQNLILSRQIDQFTFTHRITSELLHQLQLMGLNTITQEKHINNLKNIINSYTKKIDDLTNQLEDLQSHSEILSTFHNEDKKQLQNLHYNIEFLIQSQFNICSKLYNQTHFSNASITPKTMISSTLPIEISSEIAFLKSENDKLKSNSAISIRRYLSIISDLKKQVKQLQFDAGTINTFNNTTSDYLYDVDYSRSNDTNGESYNSKFNTISDINIAIKNYDIETLKNAHAALQTQYMALLDDINDLKIELVEKNKLVDKLIHHQTFDLSSSEIELSNGKWKFLEKLKQVLPITLNFSEINQLIELNTQLKIELQDAFMKNIMLKENIITLGNEIHRLNQEKINMNQQSKMINSVT